MKCYEDDITYNCFEPVFLGIRAFNKLVDDLMFRDNPDEIYKYVQGEIIIDITNLVIYINEDLIDCSHFK